VASKHRIDYGTVRIFLIRTRIRKHDQSLIERYVQVAVSVCVGGP
jgi:hypothetical protein